MKRSKTYVDHLGIQALANVYPIELGRIIFLSIETGKVVLHSFMDSDHPSMKLIRADDTISCAAVKAAMLVGVTFIKYTPGIGEKELGGHYDNLDVLPDHKDDDKSTTVINNESQQGEAESMEDDCLSSKSSESSSSENSDTADSVLSSGEDSTEDDGGESGEEIDGGESGEDWEKVDGAAGSGSGDIAEVTARIIFHLCRSFLNLIFCVHLKI